MEPKKHEGDHGGLLIQSDKHEGQRAQLFHREYAQVLRASQDNQGGELKDHAEGPDGASHDAEERRE